MAFVVPSERDRREVQCPETIVDFFEGDVFTGQRGRDKQRSTTPRNGAAATHAARFHVPLIFKRGQASRQGSARGLVSGCGRVIIERFVGPLLVVFAHEPAKALLLRAAVRSWRARGLGFQHPMKLLMGTVLFGMPWRDAFRDDAQSDPPHRQRREAAQAGTGKGEAVVAPNAVRQPVLGKRTGKSSLCRGDSARKQ